MRAYIFDEEENKEKEEFLINEIKIKIDDYTKLLLSVSEEEVKIYAGELAASGHTEEEKSALVLFMASRWNDEIKKASELKSRLEKYINKDVVFRNKISMNELYKRG